MSEKAGALLWRRMRFLVTGPIDIDTGLKQPNQSFPDYSPNEPALNDPTRIQVIPLAPTPAWGAITHGQPFLDPATNTIHVLFDGGAATINVLFWDPHAILGPGQADPYNGQ